MPCSNTIKTSVLVIWSHPLLLLFIRFRYFTHYLLSLEFVAVWGTVNTASTAVNTASTAVNTASTAVNTASTAVNTVSTAAILADE